MSGNDLRSAQIMGGYIPPGDNFLINDYETGELYEFVPLPDDFGVTGLLQITGAGKDMVFSRQKTKYGTLIRSRTKCLRDYDGNPIYAQLLITDEGRILIREARMPLMKKLESTENSPYLTSIGTTGLTGTTRPVTVSMLDGSTKLLAVKSY